MRYLLPRNPTLRRVYARHLFGDVVFRVNLTTRKFDHE